MTVLTVGNGQQFQTIAAAVAASHDGDTVQIQAGTYTNDFAEIRTKITLQGVGGTVNMVASGDIPNGKAILITDTDVTLANISFSGATVADGNGAGIRYQGGNLTILGCDFHDNQDGLLAASVTGGTITIKNSEFFHNGIGDGYTHNLYVGDIASLVVEDSYFHGAVVGHEIKSRAESTTVINSRIQDEPGGTASYGIDLPNGGNATIYGNVIEKGAASQNPVMIAFGEEGNVHAGSSLTVSNNTVINDYSAHIPAAVWNASGAPATISGMSVYGLSSAQILRGSGTVAGVTMLRSEPALDTSAPWATLAATSPATPGATATPSAAASAGSGADVFRFFDRSFGTQFLTANAGERDQLLASRPDLSYEGKAFGNVTSSDPNASAVFRFFDGSNGTHFFTASATERDAIVASRPDMTFEGAAFSEHASAQGGDAAVYRFFDAGTGTHFFTASGSERAAIIATRPDMVAEGIAFYAPS